MNLDIELHEGEILGIGGLANCGMHELGKIIYGISKPVTGNVVHHKTNETIKKASSSIKHNNVFVKFEPVKGAHIRKSRMSLNNAVMIMIKAVIQPRTSMPL